MPFVAYDVSIQLIEQLAVVVAQLEERDADLADQMRRAATSVSLNLGEGAGCSAGRRRVHYEIAHGSAREVKACLDVAVAWGWARDYTQPRAVLDRLLGLLWGLTKGKWIKTRKGVPIRESGPRGDRASDRA